MPAGRGAGATAAPLDAVRDLRDHRLRNQDIRWHMRGQPRAEQLVAATPDRPRARSLHTFARSRLSSLLAIRR